ncbi:MAG: hypothetical protein ABH879_04545 [archaeon]
MKWCVFLVVLLIAGTAVAITDEDTLREGESKTYDVGVNKLAVTLTYADGDQVKLNVNGNEYGPVPEGGSIELMYGVVFDALIVSVDSDGTDTVRYRLGQATGGIYPVESGTGSGTGGSNNQGGETGHREFDKPEETIDVLSHPVAYALAEGETGSYDVGGNKLEITPVYIDGGQVKFSANGEAYGPVDEGRSVALAYGVELDVLIISQEAGVDHVRFSLRQPAQDIDDPNVGTASATIGSGTIMVNGDDNSVTIMEGDTAKVTIDGVSYSVNALYIDQGTAKLMVNGKTAYTIEEGKEIEIDQRLKFTAMYIGRKNGQDVVRLRIQRIGQKQEYVSGRLIVGFSSDVTEVKARDIVAPFGKITSYSAVLNYIVLSVEAGTEKDIMAKLKGLPGVRYVEPDYILSVGNPDEALSGTEITATSTETVLNHATISTGVIAEEGTKDSVLIQDGIVISSDSVERPINIVHTCTDGIKNDGEEGVDCGGPCKSCTPTKETCNGCLVKDSCLDYGIRLVQDDVPGYCGLDRELHEQAAFDGACQNNYECQSNQCVDGACGSIAEELRKTQGLMEKILSWFAKIF